MEDRIIEEIMSIEQYELETHNLSFTFLVITKCGKVFQILKTVDGFVNDSVGYYVSPNNPLNNGDDEIAIRKEKQDVIEYLRNNGWLDYKKPF